jgi:hypothetical protein
LPDLTVRLPNAAQFTVCGHSQNHWSSNNRKRCARQATGQTYTHGNKREYSQPRWLRFGPQTEAVLATDDGQEVELASHMDVDASNDGQH